MSDTLDRSIDRVTRPKPYGDGTTRCPLCGGELTTCCYYIERRGYVVRLECANALGDKPACEYRRVL